jgi:excisionase family DNA binding protein
MEMQQSNTQYLNAKEAAKYLRVSLSTLFRMEVRGELVALRTPGGHRRYTVEMLNACLKSPATQLFIQQDSVHHE